MCSCPEAGLPGMARWARKLVLLLALGWGLAALLTPVWAGTTASATAAAPVAPYPGIGRPATPSELAAWDIDVRPDFKGLPRGAGTVTQGQDVWEAKCASCHGVFGESNEVFNPLVGGTTADDVRTGRVARLRDPAYPARTTLMKMSSVSALWDYINRAMPWNAPKSLSVTEVYAVTAYLLHLGDVLPADFVLSDTSMPQAQQRLPNRHGTTTRHALWPGAGLGPRAARPDVNANACMRDCAAEPKVASLLPDFARNAHGNLAEQNRAVGAQLGVDTTRPATTAAPATRTTVAAATTGAGPAPALSGAVQSDGAAVAGMLRQHACSACHAMQGKLIGPSFREINRKYAGKTDAAGYLAGKITSGGTGVWGSMAMPSQGLPEADARRIAQWLADGAAR